MRYKRYSTKDVTKASSVYADDIGTTLKTLNLNHASRYIAHLLMVTISVLIELTEAIEDLVDRNVDEDDGEAWRGGR